MNVVLVMNSFMLDRLPENNPICFLEKRVLKSLFSTHTQSTTIN